MVAHIFLASFGTENPSLSEELNPRVARSVGFPVSGCVSKRGSPPNFANWVWTMMVPAYFQINIFVSLSLGYVKIR